MPPTIHIHLLDEFRISVDHDRINLIERSRQQALLAYLLLHRHSPQPRQQVAFTLWPDSSEKQAHTNLRKLFFQLRNELPESANYFIANTNTIGWRSDAPFTLDVAELEVALEHLQAASLPDLSSIERVMALYRGELLPGCYDDWILPIRRSLHERVMNAMMQALAMLELHREYKLGIQVAERLLHLDPLQETTCRQLMHLHALNGDRVGALQVYHEYVTKLEQELGVPPATETQAIYQRLLKVESQAEARSEAADLQRRGRIPLVGRSDEWKALRQTWNDATRRGPHMMTIWGEPGIGKTRLVEEFMHWVQMRSGTVIYARAYAGEGDLSYAPITMWLRTEAVYSRLATLGDVWVVELLRLLPELQHSSPQLAAPPPITEGWQRQRFHEAIVRAFLAASAPRFFVLDDLQWCDPETLSWLRYLLRFDSQEPITVVGTVRSETVDAQHPLQALRQQLQREDQWTDLELSPLSSEETIVLAGHFTNANIAPWATYIYQETEGNPLFVVEMMQAGLMLDRLDLRKAQGINLTPTLQTVLETRLAQLSPTARQLAQLAATIGRFFTSEVLVAASELNEEDLIVALDELWQRRIVRERGQGYDFSHDKLREVAYRQQSQLRRQWLHRRISAALAKLYAGKLEGVAGELTEHAEQAGQLGEAVAYQRLAAEVAQRVGAYPEVIMRLRKAIAWLPSLPLAQEDKMGQELAMLVPLGACLVATRGYGDIDVENTYKRAYELCTLLGDDPNLMPILIGLSLFYMIRGELHQALAIARRSLRMARRIHDLELLLESHHALGSILQYLGKFRASVIHLQKAIALYDPALHSGHAAIYGQDPYVVSQVLLSISLWMLGHADQCVGLMQEGLAYAHKLGHRYSICFAQGFAAHLYQLGQEEAKSQAAALIAQEYADRHGFRYWQVISTMFSGWATARLHASAQPPVHPQPDMLVPMLDAYTGFKQTGAGLYNAFYLGLIIEAQMAVGDLDAAMRAVNEAQAIIDGAEDRFWVAEIHRLRGELLLCQVQETHTNADAEIEAEHAFLQAIQVAQTQGTRSLELRAATSLTKLWLRQGKRDQVRAMLAPLVGRFTEGFDTHDLQSTLDILATLE